MASQDIKSNISEDVLSIGPLHSGSTPPAVDCHTITEQLEQLVEAQPSSQPGTLTLATPQGMVNAPFITAVGCSVQISPAQLQLSLNTIETPHLP